MNGFSEADQEKLYNLAHDKKGQGRQGLGIAGRPKKVIDRLLAPCLLLPVDCFTCYVGGMADK